MATPEGRIKSKVTAALKQLGVYRFMPVQNGMGAPALDYYCCVYGHFVAVETKAPGKTLTPRQCITKAAIEESGGQVFVVDGETSLHAMVAWIMEAKNGTARAVCRGNR